MPLHGSVPALLVLAGLREREPCPDLAGPKKPNVPDDVRDAVILQYSD